MASVFDIDAYLRQQLERKHGKLGLVQRHKLCYGVYRLGIALMGDAPFFATVEPWQLGPVFPELHSQPNLGGDLNALGGYQRILCSVVTKRLAGISGKKLAARSHRKYPEWRIAIECGEREIRTELIRSVSYDAAQMLPGFRQRIKLSASDRVQYVSRQLKELFTLPGYEELRACVEMTDQCIQRSQPS
jgi:uncharacterized phage-associated protein